MAFTCSLALPVRPAFIYSAQHITAQPPESFAQIRNNNWMHQLCAIFKYLINAYAMVRLSLLQPLFAKRILPPVFERFFGFSDDGVSPFSDMLPELLHHIIDSLHDDKRTLLALSLASKQTTIHHSAYVSHHRQLA